jgi:hypothetical protein
MKKATCASMLVLFAIVLSGCSSFDKFKAERRLSSEYPVFHPATTSLAKPFRLGIILELETADSSGEYLKAWNWGDTEKRMVSSYADSLVKEGAVSGYFFITNQDLPLNDLNAMMNKGTESSADALLTVRGVINVRKYMNPIGILDPTIIGAIVLPGSNMDVTLLSSLELWDLKAHKPLVSLRADGIKKECSTTLFIRTNSANTENAVNAVMIETLRKLLIDFKKDFAGIKFQAVPPPYPKSEVLKK